MGQGARVRGPFTAAQAAADGLSEAALRSRALRCEHHGVYVDARLDPSLALSVAAARLVLPADAVLTACLRCTRGASTSAILGRCGSPARTATRSDGPVSGSDASARCPPTDATGSCVTAQTAFLAAAQELDLVDLVAAGKWLVRLRRATPTGLCEAAAAHRGRGAVLVRRASALVRDRVDSPQETRLRLCLVLAGLPEPEVNPVVFAGGRAVGRVDLFLGRWRVAVEYEGDQHRTDPRQWHRLFPSAR